MCFNAGLSDLSLVYGMKEQDVRKLSKARPLKLDEILAFPDTKNGYVDASNEDFGWMTKANMPGDADAMINIV